MKDLASVSMTAGDSAKKGGDTHRRVAGVK